MKIVRRHRPSATTLLRRSKKRKTRLQIVIERAKRMKRR